MRVSYGIYEDKMVNFLKGLTGSETSQKDLPEPFVPLVQNQYQTVLLDPVLVRVSAPVSKKSV